ncbi:MAG TPA: hypothetical protein VFV68_15845 [Agriterribacter sp.]|nr:hypothetical protein [Agriterribacter sp.]
MTFDLNKREKKLARELIAIGIENAYKKALESTEEVIKTWRLDKITNRQAYQQVYREIHLRDKDIAQRYNWLTGSKYFQTVATLFTEKVISEKDIAGFSDETKRKIYAFCNNDDEN